MVLEFDFYQEDMNEEVLQHKRVGGRKLTLREIERAKKCLSTLFPKLKCLLIDLL